MGAGLSSDIAKERLQQFGYNEVTARSTGFWLKLGRWAISPITLMLLAAAFLSWRSGRLFDCYFILFLTFLNFGINFYQERRANNAIKKLQEKLTVQVKVRRDGSWLFLPSRQVVPGDLVELNVGDLVPADVQIAEAKNCSANESALTGESLPKEKSAGAKLYSGSYVATGSVTGTVTATGGQTAFGKTLISVEKASKRSLLEKEILSIAYFLTIISLICVVILSIILSHDRTPLGDLLRLDLSLIIAGVPVSLPAVMTIIISLGVLDLSRQQVIVRRMSALENLSDVNLLLTDKTGTLTESRVTVEKVVPLQKITEAELVGLAQLTLTNPDKNALEKAVALKAAEYPRLTAEPINLIPADSVRKRSTVFAQVGRERVTLSLGAPQVIAGLSRLTPAIAEHYQAAVDAAAAAGYRTLALSRKQASAESEKDMTLLGLILLSDQIRPDAESAINYLRQEGITTKMVTGDDLAIARRVAGALSLEGAVIDRVELKKYAEADLTRSWWEQSAGFARVLPEDKYFLTEQAKRQFVVAVTGDGVNDLPAVSAADVGIAVSNAVDALKSSADIVMLKSGISYVKNALLEARKIFERLYSYSVYRISESFRLIITITVLGVTIHTYPISPIQLILLAFLNDIPIISLAYNRVKLSSRPSKSRSRNRLLRGLLHGSVGVASSLSMYYVLSQVVGLSLPLIETAFFLKLTVSGHLLIYVAHTDQPWYRFLPSRPVISATTATQLIASTIAGLGLFMPAISLSLILFVWVWSFGWMQVSDLLKHALPQK